MRPQTPALSKAQPPILWLAIGVLAALQGVFTLSWVSYRIHLPGLLAQLEFSPGLAAAILLVEALLAIAIEPIAGRMSDRLVQRHQSRFPLILLGVGLAALLFVAIPLLTVGVPPAGAARWLLPGLLVAWAIAMSLCRSPALALLRHYASVRYLPQAASLLTFTAGLAGAVAPLGKPFILSLGAAIPFTIGAVLLLGIGVLLRYVDPDRELQPPGLAASRGSLSPRLLLAMFGLGLAVTLVSRITLETFPRLLKTQLPESNPPLLVGVFFISLAIAALPAGVLGAQLGVRRTMLLGVATLIVCLILMPLLPNPGAALGLAIVMGIGFSFLSNGTLPLILSLSTLENAGLAIGLFFSGAATAAALMEAGVSSLTQSVGVPIAIGLITLALAGCCITVRAQN